MVSTEQIEKLIRASLQQLSLELEVSALADPVSETTLFGSGGALDSLALVHLIADIESRISDEFKQEIIIADERAMSRSRSPFRTFGTLCSYVAELLNESANVT